MKSSVKPRDLLETFAQKYSLRLTERSRHYLGIYNGLCIDAFEHRGTITLTFFSPMAELGEMILEDFSGFENLKTSRIPPSWLMGMMRSRDEGDSRGCVLELDKGRLALIPKDDFLKIPQLLALDFQSFGAHSQIESCDSCGCETPKNLLLVGDAYQVLCDRCFESLRDHAPTGELEPVIQINWRATAPSLFLGTVAFSFVWGLVQQPKALYVVLILMGPIAAAVLLTRRVAHVAEGMTLGLRLLTVFCIMVSVLIGNIWRFHTQLNRVGAFLVSESIELYFTKQIEVNGEYESLFYLGGLIGAWIGFRTLKSVGRVKYE